MRFRRRYLAASAPPPASIPPAASLPTEAPIPTAAASIRPAASLGPAADHHPTAATHRTAADLLSTAAPITESQRPPSLNQVESQSPRRQQRASFRVMPPAIGLSISTITTLLLAYHFRSATSETPAEYGVMILHGMRSSLEHLSLLMEVIASTFAQRHASTLPLVIANTLVFSHTRTPTQPWSATVQEAYALALRRSCLVKRAEARKIHIPRMLRPSSLSFPHLSPPFLSLPPLPAHHEVS